MKIDSYREKYISISEEDVKNIVDNEKEKIDYFESGNRYFRSTKFVDMTTDDDRKINRTVVMVVHQDCLNPKDKGHSRRYGNTQCFLNPKFIHMLEAIRSEKV